MPDLELSGKCFVEEKALKQYLKYIFFLLLTLMIKQLDYFTQLCCSALLNSFHKHISSIFFCDKN